jgi:hypothetical protein
MSTNPALIDSTDQEKDQVTYWMRRQGLLTGGSGKYVSLVKLKVNAHILLDKTVWVASAAGIKNIFQYLDRATWNGPEIAATADGDSVDLQTQFEEFQQDEFEKIKSTLKYHFYGLTHQSLDWGVKVFFDVGMQLRPANDQVLLSHLDRSKHYLEQSIGLNLVSQESATSHAINNAVAAIDDEPLPDVANELPAHDMVGNLSGDEADDEASEDEVEQAVDDDSSPGDEVASLGMERNDDGDVPGDAGDIGADDRGHVAEAMDYRDILMQDIDHSVARNSLKVMSYPKRFTRDWGNVHSGSVRLNAVEDGAIEGKVKLVIPSTSHCLGGQIYSPSLRVESMHQTRPKRVVIQSLAPHATNLCTNGLFFNASLSQSMKEVADCLEVMNEIFVHRDARRRSEISSVIRIELFLVFNNDGVPIGSLPPFDPTYCVDLFHRDLVDNFEAAILVAHLDPINKTFCGLRDLVNNQQLLTFENLGEVCRCRILASLELLMSYTDDVLGNCGIVQKNLRLHHSDTFGITMDIPHSARVPLREEEKLCTGFSYGVDGDLLPLVSYDLKIRPGRTLEEVTRYEAHKFMAFPACFSTVDRSVARALSVGVNVSSLEGMKAQIHIQIEKAVRQSKGLPRTPPRLGLMHVLDLQSLITCPAEVRLALYRKLSQLLIMSICHVTWKEMLKDKVLGASADLENASAQQGTDRFGESFRQFPFDDHSIHQYINYVEGTKFVTKNPVSNTGKLIMAEGISMFSVVLDFFIILFLLCLYLLCC